jgi:hypothetical protein
MGIAPSPVVETMALAGMLATASLGGVKPESSNPNPAVPP